MLSNFTKHVCTQHSICIISGDRNTMVNTYYESRIKGDLFIVFFSHLMAPLSCQIAFVVQASGERGTP